MRSASATRKKLLEVTARQNENTAWILAYLGEIERRGLHESLGYATMLDFCMGQLKMCEEDAAERIEVARAGLAFPVLLEAIGDGRLHLPAVRLLAPHLNAANVDELVAAMTHRPEDEIAAMLAEWFAGPSGT